MMCAPAVPCTAVLAGGAHNIPEVQHVIPYVVILGPFPCEAEGNEENWTHERKP
jgi:hypothetical protein